MVIQQINNWLNSRRDIEAGRTLISSLEKDYPINQSSLKLIMKFDNASSRALLERELEKIKELVNSATRPEPVEKKNKTFFRDLEDKTLPKELQELYEQVKKWYRELDTLRGRSREMPEGDKLRDAALRIVRLDKQIRKAYMRLDYFANYGVDAPGEMASLPKDEQMSKFISWLLALKQFPPYISKFKNSEDPDKQKEVVRRKLVLEEINEFLREHAD